MAIANGIITHLDAEGRFAYLTERDGDSVRIHGKLKDFDKLEKGSEVVLQYDNEFIKGEYKKGAKALLEIYSPFEPVIVLGTVIRVSDKGFAFVRCDGFKDDVHAGPDVFRKADVKPGRGMPVVVTVGQNARGFTVTNLVWKPEEIAAWRAENLPSEIGTLKYFDPKGYGFIVREDGSQIGFHIMGATADLRDDFKKKYRKGTTFKFMVGDYRGKPTALLTELVALAPEPEVAPVESVEAVALEAAVPVEDVPIAVVAEPEAKTAKAPRKKAAAKPKKISPKKSTKAAAAPEPKPAAAPEPESDDIAAMAARHCANGGGAMAEAFATATKH